MDALRCDLHLNVVHVIFYSSTAVRFVLGKDNRRVTVRSFGVLNDIIWRIYRIAFARLIYLNRVAIKVWISKMSGRSFKVHNRKEELVVVFVDPRSPPDDLLKFGHRADFAVENNKLTGLSIDAGRH